MNKEQIITGGVTGATSQTPVTPAKKPYYQPQLTTHGKLERMTLDDASPTGSAGGGGGTDFVPDE